MITREELLQVMRSAADAEYVWPLIEKLQQELVCDVCAGTGSPPAETCACRGTNDIHEVLLTVRQEYAKLQQENTDLRAQYDKGIAAVAANRDEWQEAATEYLALLNDARKVLVGFGVSGSVMAMDVAQRIADKIGDSK